MPSLHRMPVHSSVSCPLSHSTPFDLRYSRSPPKRHMHMYADSDLKICSYPSIDGIEDLKHVSCQTQQLECMMILVKAVFASFKATSNLQQQRERTLSRRASQTRQGI